MPVSMNLMSMQAESMLASAMNRGNNFNKAATAFFRTANESKLEGNALIALHSAARDASKGKNAIATKWKSMKVYSDLSKALENGIKGCNELKQELAKFTASLNKKYKETLGVRVSLAADGAVRANEVHKSARSEKLVAGLKNLVRTE